MGIQIFLVKFQVGSPNHWLVVYFDFSILMQSNEAYSHNCFLLCWYITNKICSCNVCVARTRKGKSREVLMTDSQCTDNKFLPKASTCTAQSLLKWAQLLSTQVWLQMAVMHLATGGKKKNPRKPQTQAYAHTQLYWWHIHHSNLP